ncbi:MAG: C40 family peptidase [Caldimonas sp.]
MRLPSNAPACLARHAACIAALAFCAGAACAAPHESADPVLRLLAERHLLQTPLAASTEATPSAPIGVDATAARNASKLLGQMRDRVADLVLTALKSVGVRYVRGGTTEENGFDCSGFTRYVFENSLGLVLPRRVDEQAHAPGLVAVKREDLQPGDLVFFNTLKRTFSHVGIYIGDNRFVHAPRPGGEVRTEDMGYVYWKKRFTGARRAEIAVQAQAPSASTDPSATALR